MAGKKSKKHSSISRMLFTMNKSKRLLNACFLLIILTKLCLVMAPSVSRAITDKLAEFVQFGSYDMPYIVKRCMLLGALFLLGYGAEGFVNRIMARLSNTYMFDLRNRSLKKLNHLPINYIDTHPAGDLLSRLTNDMQQVSTMLETTAVTLVGQAVLLVGVAVMMFVTDFRLALIYVVSLPLTMIVSRSISKVSKKETRKQQNALGDLTAHVTDTYTNHMIVKSYCCEEKKLSDFDALNKRFFKTYVKSRFIAGFLIPITSVITNLSYTVLCVLGGYLLIKGKLTLGEFQAFIFYGNMISSPLSSIASSMNTIQAGFSALDRIYEFLDEEEEPVESPEAFVDLNTVRGNVAFSHVRFGYTPEKQLMSDVSFSVQDGMTAAIVGPSGAGKTTLINLLMRFYEISGGNISLDGTDIGRLGRENLRSAFGMVLQDSWIFDGTIAENIGYGKKNATIDEIKRAAEIVKCNSFINKLPDGYNTHISEENSALSSGEKQLLAIARTVLADPKILILDEATSQVDTRTELLITEAMNKLMEGRTCFVIAHRLYTIRNSDIIIFMKDGDIKEVGSHDELMYMNGLYASMYNSASD